VKERFELAVKVTVWNEYVHEIKHPLVADIYPRGIHMAIAEGICRHEPFEVRTATLEEPEHGLTQEVLDQTDVLIWWGHARHEQVQDKVVERVYRRVLNGMGLIVLHSASGSKLFKKLMGTACEFKWREANDKERLWVVDPAHPIAEGLQEYIEIEEEEMYGEYFDIPAPDELIFISWFTGGEVFRSGCTYKRGLGKIFFFRPGHEEYPTYHHKDVLKVIANAVKWAAPQHGAKPVTGNVAPLEELAQARRQ
jgi:trehalose utilization protein